MLMMGENVNIIKIYLYISPFFLEINFYHSWLKKIQVGAR